MSAATTAPQAAASLVAPSPAKPAKARRSASEDALLVRGRKTFAVLPSLLAGIAKKDANAAKPRIDQAWVTQLGELVTQAEAAAGARPVGLADQRKATALERTQCAQLCELLSEVRSTIAQHNPTDDEAQTAFGRGVVLKPKVTSATLGVATSFLQAWQGQWKTVATKSGITQSTMDQIQSLHDALSAADAQQGTVMTANAQSTVDRAALFRTLKTMTGYAAKVAQSVFGKTSRQAQSLADPRPLTNRGAKRRAATKAKKLADKVAKKTAKAAKRKDYAAAAKRRAKRAAVAARATSLAEPVTPTKKANAKAAKKKPSR